MIKGKNVSLRHLLASDLPHVLDLMNDLEARGEYMRTGLRAPFNFQKDFAENGLSADAYELLLIVDQGNVIVGTLGHFTTRSYTDVRELGYQIFRSSFRQKGYASEAVGLLADNLFRNRPINRLELVIECHNIASERVALRCGFQREGIMRGQVFLGGRHVDTYLYGLTRSDWEAHQAQSAATG